MLPGAAQAHVKRALSAVTHRSLVNADDEVAEFRLHEPHRHLPPQHAALARTVRSIAVAFAGDDKRNLGAVRLGLAQEGK